MIVNRPLRCLWCDTCKAWTEHAFGKELAQSVYRCNGCKQRIIYFIVRPKENNNAH